VLCCSASRALRLRHSPTSTHPPSPIGNTLHTAIPYALRSPNGSSTYPHTYRLRVELIQRSSPSTKFSLSKSSYSVCVAHLTPTTCLLIARSLLLIWLFLLRRVLRPACWRTARTCRPYYIDGFTTATCFETTCTYQ